MELKTLSNTALIGHTGFVGSNLLRQHSFDHTFNSKNFADLENKHFGLVVCAGISAAKWLANKEPENDKLQIEKLKNVLKTVSADYFILISTIDVYNPPLHVAEDDTPVMEGHHAYGSHRYEFERFVTSHFKNSLILRLPALFGPGLKKNAIFDLLNENNIEQINPAGSFQWYPVDRLWADIEIAAAADLNLLNVSTEPLTMDSIATKFFPHSKLIQKSGDALAYDMWSVHAEKFGEAGRYLLNKEAVLKALSSFVSSNTHARL